MKADRLFNLPVKSSYLMKQNVDSMDYESKCRGYRIGVDGIDNGRKFKTTSQFAKTEILKADNFPFLIL